MIFPSVVMLRFHCKIYIWFCVIFVKPHNCVIIEQYVTILAKTTISEGCFSTIIMSFRLS